MRFTSRRLKVLYLEESALRREGVDASVVLGPGEEHLVRVEVDREGGEDRECPEVPKPKNIFAKRLVMNQGSYRYIDHRSLSCTVPFYTFGNYSQLSQELKLLNTKNIGNYKQFWPK